MKYSLFIKDRFGKKLEILQEIPGKGDKFPTVIMVPGFGIDLHERGLFDDISAILLRYGFCTFRFSFEGSGKSEGDFVNMTIEKQVQQFMDILDYVKKDRFTIKNKIGIYAQSFGVSSVIASLPLKGIKTYLFTGSNAHPFDSMSKSFKRKGEFNPEGVSKRQRSDNSYTRIGPQFWESLQNVNLIEKIALIDKPVNFIHAGFDRNVKPIESLDLFDAVKLNKYIQYIPKADHAFSGKFRPQVVALIAKWFEEKLY